MIQSVTYLPPADADVRIPILRLWCLFRLIFCSPDCLLQSRLSFRRQPELLRRSIFIRRVRAGPLGQRIQQRTSDPESKDVFHVNGETRELVGLLSFAMSFIFLGCTEVPVNSFCIACITRCIVAFPAQLLLQWMYRAVSVR